MNLPPWAPTLYPRQASAIAQAISAFNSGSKIVILDAPTGSGKTLIAELIHQSLQTRSIYACSSIALQDQFHRDFPSSAIIKGRSNYPTQDTNLFPELTAGDCIKSREEMPACNSCPSTQRIGMHCRWCHPVNQCPYEQAKRSAILNPLVVTNLHYYLYEANYQGVLSANRGLVIIDEADMIEEVILSFVEVTITKRWIKELDIYPPEKKTVQSAWEEWAKEALLKVSKLIEPVRKTDDIRVIRKKKFISTLRDNLKRLTNQDSGLHSGGWVYTGYDQGNISFKPIRVGDYCDGFLWRHNPRFLLMSATTISFDALAESLGIK